MQRCVRQFQHFNQMLLPGFSNPTPVDPPKPPKPNMDEPEEEEDYSYESEESESEESDYYSEMFYSDEV